VETIRVDFRTSATCRHLPPQVYAATAGASTNTFTVSGLSGTLLEASEIPSFHSVRRSSASASVKDGVVLEANDDVMVN
jgi:hypothetical protein